MNYIQPGNNCGWPKYHWRAERPTDDQEQ
ncbi:hypothetical protein RQP50_27150 [Paenibacillus sp. chi10]|uniref:Uncharacterized protein n=1 Tax=Paenibacillus suaedae TaxID=3077233 RepID=A0AAJ2N7U2_9BACL|nr:hypothetical protein [Paenibacillus sp. chi10]MDT8979920.1 hypothetical protein [Paenibacillus sp. chi10]